VRKLFAFLVIALSLTVQAQKKSEITAQPLVFTHVTVIDATGAPPQPDMTVVITGNRITALGKIGKVYMPTDAQVVNAEGKYMIPGLWDMHAHIFSYYKGPSGQPAHEERFPLFIANGVTGLRLMWVRTGQAGQAEGWRKQAIEQPGSVPRIVAIGTIVDGSPPTHPNSDVVNTADEARQMVDKIKASGVDFVKVYWNLSREAYFAIADEAHKQHIPFAGHVPVYVSAFEASDAGQKSIEHLDGLLLACSSKEQELMNIEIKDWNEKNQKQMLETFDEAKCGQLFSQFQKNGTWQVPTLVIHHRGPLALEGSLAVDERLKYIPRDEREEWRKFSSQLENRPAEQISNNPKAWQMNLNLVGAMHRAGVEIMAGADVGNPYIYPGFSLHDELALFVKAGLTPMEALQSATRNPARFLGMQDSLGTIEKGKLADLVLLDANPLQDISNIQRINAVVINGKFLNRESLDKMLADAETFAAKK
jgi:predicted amidohydrolase